jgi:hypothetical protein
MDMRDEKEENEALQVKQSPVDGKESAVLFYRQVPRKPRLTCPVKYEAYLTGVGGDESAQLKNNKITFPGCPALPARLQAKLI